MRNAAPSEMALNQLSHFTDEYIIGENPSRKMTSSKEVIESFVKELFTNLSLRKSAQPSVGCSKKPLLLPGCPGLRSRDTELKRATFGSGRGTQLLLMSSQQEGG
jgi:hypothetical protein